MHPSRVAPVVARAAYGLALLVVLALAILSRPEKRLNDFDQSFYLTAAYDLAHHGVFSGGMFDGVDSTDPEQKPPPGMFLAPGYPVLVYLAMQADPRFARAVDCNTLANHGKGDLASCEFYARPIHLLHALLLALAAVAIGLTAEAIFGAPLFFAAATLAAAGFIVEADLFSFIMTESLTIAVFSLAALALVWALRSDRLAPAMVSAVLAGVGLGLLVLARPGYIVLAPVWVLVVIAGRRRWAGGLVLLVALAAVVGPWVIRNAVSVGKIGLTEEYGSATLVERFAFDAMTLREGLLALPYCVPVVGPRAVEALAGPGVMDRFEYDAPDSFFAVGRGQREALVAQGPLDPVIGGLFRSELAERGLNYVLTTIPLAWCGLWVAQGWSVLFLPLFAAACVVAMRRPIPLFLLYSGPAFIMVAVHAAAANHYPRYNLMLIGPISVGAAWIVSCCTALTWTRREPRPSP